MTLTVHHLQRSQSERIPWLCEELGIPYTLKTYQRDPLLSPPSLKQLSVLGAAPVITDTTAPYSESQPLVLAESGAVAEYIINRHGEGRLTLPPSHPEYADYLYWWHFSNGNLQPTIARQFYGTMLGADPASNPMAGRMEERLHTVLQHMDEKLKKGPWLAGQEFTAADVMSVFPLTTMRVFYNFSLKGYDGILGWLERVGQREAYKRAMEKGDPGMGPYLGEESPELLAPVKAVLGRN